MSRELFIPPSPEVQHLPTLLRRVQAGEIRVPAFQRDYVWLEKQIVELLESIYKGYPIGSLLFWQPTDASIAIRTDGTFPIPQAVDKKPATYVLDGQQRLATVYNCFYYRDSLIADRFNVTFDLREMTFQHFRSGDPSSGRLHLASLFAPKAFIEAQQTLSQEDDGDALLDQSVALHTAFQEYMIPLVTIKGRSVADVVNIFERVNNTGLRLSTVDFMRAVTWSGDFDLAKESSRLRAQSDEVGFAVPYETIVKIIAISQGLDPLPDSMLLLRELSASVLLAAVECAGRAIASAISFLKSHLHVYSYDYVPYEAQMLVIAKLFLASNFAPSSAALASLRRWFIATSIGEELQGKSDSVVGNIVRSVEALAAGDDRVFQVRIEVTAEDLIHRKFIVRRALSSALAVTFAELGARSVFTGQPVPSEEYMSEFSASHFVPILDGADILRATGSSDKRIFANMLLVSDDDRKKLKGKSAVTALGSAQLLLSQEEMCKSQAISSVALRYLRDERPAEFLAQRARDILEAVHTVVR